MSFYLQAKDMPGYVANLVNVKVCHFHKQDNIRKMSDNTRYYENHTSLK